MNYQFRKDNRTEKEFAKDIKKRSNKQSELMELFDKEMERLGIQFKFYDNGVDNTGEVIKKALDIGNADYRVTFEQRPFLDLEVKATPVLDKASFKKHALKSCIKNNYIILLFINSKFPPEPADINELYWSVLNKKHIQQIHDLPLDKHMTQRFGGKPTVQVRPLFTKFEKLGIPIRKFNEDYDPKELEEL